MTAFHPSPARCSWLLALLLTVAPPGLARAQNAPPTCATDPLFQRLDFWLGEWSVWVGERQVGRNRISKVLRGCAVIEEWRAGDGGEGRSLFYVPPGERFWRQVWVTGSALAPGGTKEKQEIGEGLPGPGIRFQGTIRLNGREWLDRTTLTPHADGSVRQLIEISTDGGATWRPTFDAIYRRTPGREGMPPVSGS